MEPVPRIQVTSSWDRVPLDYQQPHTPQLYATSDFSTTTPFPDLQYIEQQEQQEQQHRPSSLKKQKSDSGLRKGFWSRIKRSKSVDRASEPLFSDRSSPQWAIAAGENLVWCPERQIWVFPREQECSSPHQHHRRRRTEERAVSASATAPSSPLTAKPRGSPEYGELLFAQMPGHYPLSVYDSVNDGQCLPVYERGGHLDDVARKTGTESQWTLVAKRVSGSSERGSFY
ncbi:hypothetical protein AJ80_03579 [Polytolypa hystricis UAMH7299]|uniref:Uncharacterized protein n=1 Tax=Polytolypa hystricis (strain UAMH7299) TaxID=1447883 RepID=A0A2B7YHD5_POLH7|nr:hypothetical protein AJ80_03579 [Polytolypa hystricis UAMH7299]